MVRFRVIPVLLYERGGLYKTVKFARPTYVGDPLNAVKIFNEKEVDELVLLDIGAAREGRRPDFEFIARLAGEAFMPVCYGGGVRTTEDMKAIISAGVEKVAVNTSAVESPEFVRAASDLFGSSTVVASIDVRRTLLGKDLVYSQGGRRGGGRQAVEHASEMEAMGAGEILLTSIDRDGTRAGYDLGLIKRVSAAVGIPLIACGGADAPADFVRAREAGASAAGAGSMFVFHGKHRAVLISYPSQRELGELFS